MIDTIADLPLSVRTATLLEQMGIRTLDALLDLPSAPLQGRAHRELRDTLAARGHGWACRLAPLDEASAVRSIEEALERLQTLEGVIIERGAPMTPLERTRAEKAIGLRFPTDYRGFLEHFGSLAVYREGFRTTIWEQTFVVGSPAPDLPGARFEGTTGVVDVSRRVLDDARQSADDLEGRFAAVLLSVNGLSEAYVLREDGFMAFLDRGAFRDSDPFGYDFDSAAPVTFEAFVVDWLDKARRTVEEHIEHTSSYDRAFATLSTASGAGACVERNGGRIFLRDDGTEVLVRPGDGNELDGRARGLFYAWHEPTPSRHALAGAMNERLLSAHAVQRADRLRLRGLLPLALPAAELAWILAHDTGLRFADARRPARITADDIHAAFATDERGFMRKFHDVCRVDGNAWTFQAGRDETAAKVQPAASGRSRNSLLDFFGPSTTPPELPPRLSYTLRLDDGIAMVETVTRAPAGAAHDMAEFVNGGATPEPHRHTNLDHERFPIAVAGGETVTLRKRLYALHVDGLDLLGAACRDLEVTINIPLRYFERERYVADRDKWAARAGEVAAILAEAQRGAAREVLDDGDFTGKSLESRRSIAVSGRRARFTGAVLRVAAFDGSDLRDADFRSADCGGASFVGSDLRGADFTGADLSGANFLFALGGPQFW